MIQVWKFWWRKLESWNTTARTLDLAPTWQTIAQESDQTVARYWWVFFVYLICLLSLIGWYDLWCAGFQGEDPKTDFRGMGILGLQNLMSVLTWWFIISIITILSSSSSSHHHHHHLIIISINISFQIFCQAVWDSSQAHPLSLSPSKIRVRTFFFRDLDQMGWWRWRWYHDFYISDTFNKYSWEIVLTLEMNKEWKISSLRLPLSTN